MDFSKSSHEDFLECNTAESEDPNTDLTQPAIKESAASELLTTDEQQSVYAAVLAAEGTVSPTAADIAERYPAETVDEQTLPISSSARSDAEESQPGALSQMKSALQEFEALRAEVLRQIESAFGTNEDGDSTMAEERTIFRRLLQSLELGIEEMQARILNVNSLLRLMLP